MKRTRTAGGLIIGPAGTLALIRKQGGALWLFPKGTVDPGEGDEDAARREIAEETGLTNLEYLDDLGSYERYATFLDGQENLAWRKEIHMFLFAAPADSVFAPTLEIEEARWVPLARVAEEIGNPRDRAWFATVERRVREAIQRD